MIITDPVDAWLSTPVPDKLWHYTSITGFYGIVDSKRIWATDVRFLNDKQEFVHIKRFANQILNALQPDDPKGLGVPGLICTSGEETHWTRRAYGTRKEVPA